MRNSDGKERCDLKEDVVTRGLLGWFSHLERMNESRVTKQIYRRSVNDEKLAAPGAAPKRHAQTRVRVISTSIRTRAAPEPGPPTARIFHRKLIDCEVMVATLVSRRRRARTATKYLIGSSSMRLKNNFCVRFIS
ncbi:hypothetical protein EVAR_68065_1 [Eumeta japonica]|uniref:Uncharacterized protein n=1 Tax=Eumeta variegata TaxID=151549 RepID=A0A4C1ZNK3_EUMVA|nr:hypothetical protein EVAR_68065_1 [Eumeta japonica]